MTDVIHAEVLVLGGGPGGYTAAFRAADLGKKVVLIEKDQCIFDTSILFRHAQGHYELYRTLIWGSGFDLLTKEGHAALSKKIEDRFALLLTGKQPPSIPLPILSCSVAGALLIMLKWWLDNKMPYSPERMDEIFQQLVMPGFSTILGLTETTEK